MDGTTATVQYSSTAEGGGRAVEVQCCRGLITWEDPQHCSLNTWLHQEVRRRGGVLDSVSSWSRHAASV